MQGERLVPLPDGKDVLPFGQLHGNGPHPANLQRRPAVYRDRLCAGPGGAAEGDGGFIQHAGLLGVGQSQLVLRLQPRQRGGGPVGEKGQNQSGLGAVRVRQQQPGLFHLYGCGQLGGPAAGEKHRQPGPVAPGGLLAPGLGGEQGHAPLPRQPGGGFVRTGFVQKAQGKALPGSRRLQRLHPVTAQRPGRFTGQSQRVKALCPGGGYGILGGLSRRGTQEQRTGGIGQR